MAKRRDRISKMPGRDLWQSRYTVQTEAGPKRKTLYARSYEEALKALTQAMADADKVLTDERGMDAGFMVKEARPRVESLETLSRDTYAVLDRIEHAREEGRVD